MFFILSKTLFYFAMPLVWIVLGVGLALFSRKPKVKRYALISSFLLLLLFSNQFIINSILKTWEPKAPPIEELDTYTIAVVLTGVTHPLSDYPDRVFFGKGADRLLQTVQLYKLGKIRKILISGGSGNIVGRKVYEADQLKKVFLYCGIPEQDLIIENQSRNTRENALFSQKILDSLGIRKDFLLVTSAFHMRRAEACFHQVGLIPAPFPVDYYYMDSKYTPDWLLIPSEAALFKWQVLIHEVIGYITYKLLGYA